MLSSSRGVSGLYSGNKYHDILQLFNTFRDYIIFVSLGPLDERTDRQQKGKKKSGKIGENLMKGKKNFQF